MYPSLNQEFVIDDAVSARVGITMSQQRATAVVVHLGHDASCDIVEWHTVTNSPVLPIFFLSILDCTCI